MSKWLSFPEAGKSIDGPRGWIIFNGGERTSAQSLLNFAARGDIQVRTQRNTVILGDEAERPATDDDRFRLISLLLAREKLGEDVLTAFVAPGMTSQILFTLCDEQNGNFELTDVLEAPSGRYITKHRVVGLEFSAEAIDRLFGQQDAEADSNGKKGRASTAGGERDCKEWLLSEFVADPDNKRSKADFRNVALAKFKGRLSKRGFDTRVWPELARKHGRDNAGAKKKS